MSEITKEELDSIILKYSELNIEEMIQMYFLNKKEEIRNKG